jgi:two-component system CheB/CheR fusion protein
MPVDPPAGPAKELAPIEPGKAPLVASTGELSPDFAEEAYAAELDNIVPTRGYQLTPLVGLGGSAGSIAALTQFFTTMPADSGMVFVVVLHLSPEHESALAEMLQRVTSMPVVQAYDEVEVRPNCVYVIPPGKHLASADGRLQLRDLTSDRGKRMAVDVFFRTLAETHGPHAAAVVLSGADGDGAIGLKRVKERGGLTIAQDPSEAEYPSMPSTAIKTGMVDWVLKIQEMPGRLLKYVQRGSRLRLPDEDGPQPAQIEGRPADEDESALRDILIYLRTRTGRDFSYYKRATIVRRISRRMQVNGTDTLQEYLAFLRTQPGESGALLQDLLISVTNFFRDHDAFLALESHIPNLFRGKGPGDAIRVWCPACATGEEAYSIAMLLAEHARTLDAPPAIQVFATDLDEDVVQSAREGLYPATIATDLSEDRLRRFFIKEHRGYRVRRELRENILFALHDLLKDSPFSRLDFVSCRNLLIYLNPDAQQRALDIFHFALRPDGMLFVGSSESAGDGSELFAPLDKKHRLYRPRPFSRVRLPVPLGAGTLGRVLREKEHAAERPSVTAAAMQPSSVQLFPWDQVNKGEPRTASFSEIHLRLFEQHGPPSILVDDQHDILHLSATAGRYLQFVAGEPTRNLMRLVHPMLRIEVRAALYRAASTGQPTEALDLPFEVNGDAQSVDLYVVPAGEPKPDYFLTVFVPRPTPAATRVAAVGDADPVAQQLEHELENIKTQMREMLEQHEVTLEEHKAGNEELQAINEELRSATEELETSREELQSINEELTTVNHELKGKVEELAHSNSDLHNLMNATAIATVFLDRDLRVARYTPTATSLFNLIPTDIGRPLSDLTGHLDYADLEQDAARVLEKLAPIEREVGKPERGWFLARLLPYRTLDDHIGGVVLTFVDITERKRNEQALRESKETLQLVIENAREYAIFTTDLNMIVTTWNSGAQRLLQYAEGEIMGQSAAVIFTPEDRSAGRDDEECRLALTEGRAADERWHQRKDGSRFWSHGFLMAMHDASGRTVGFVKILRNATEERTAKRTLEEGRAELQDALREIERARDMAEAAARAKDHFLAVLSHELRTPLTPVLIAAGALARRGDLPADVVDAIGMIATNVKMEARFIDELLDLTRISHGKMELIVGPVDAHDVVRRALQICDGDVSEKNLRLKTDLAAAEHGLQGDSSRLQQVVWNLVKNAAKFTPAEGRIHLRTFNDSPGWITIEIIDTGIGIDPAIIARIFNSFEQADSSVTRQFGGLGLGLAISRAIVEAHGGTLQAASAGVGQGATFTAHLPLAKANPTPD